MKKLSVIIFISLLFLLTACGTNKSTEKKDTQNTQTQLKEETPIEQTQDSIKTEETATETNEQTKEETTTISDNAVPDFTVTDLNGNKVNLYSLAGKVVVVDFWATWCRPCVAEIPHLNDLYNKYKDKNVVFVGLALDQKPKVEAFMKKTKMDYPVWIGTQQVAEQYKVQGIPTTYVLNKDMSVYFKQVGYAPGIEKEFDKKLAELTQ